MKVEKARLTCIDSVYDGTPLADDVRAIVLSTCPIFRIPRRRMKQISWEDADDLLAAFIFVRDSSKRDEEI